MMIVRAFIARATGYEWKDSNQTIRCCFAVGTERLKVHMGESLHVIIQAINYYLYENSRDTVFSGRACTLTNKGHSVRELEAKCNVLKTAYALAKGSLRLNLNFRLEEQSDDNPMEYYSDDNSSKISLLRGV